MNMSATEWPNFIRKYYLLHKLLIFKCWRQNISISNIALHTAVRHSGVQPTEHVRLHLFTHETPYFITPALWPANSPVDQSTTRFRGSCRSMCTTARFVTSTSWSRTWSKSGNISTRWSSMKRSASGLYILDLAFNFEHTVEILNTDFRCADVLPFARMHTWQSITPVPIMDTYTFEWPY